MKKLLPFLAGALFLVNGLKAQTYTTTNLCTGLQYPVAFDIAPNDGRFFITQKGDGNTPASTGTATIRVYNSAGTFLNTFYDLSDSVNSDFERGLLGITLDPNYATNGYVYVYYNHNWNNDERIRIVRLTDVSNVGTNPTIIFDLDVSNSIPGNHVGGNLHFRPSDSTHIYFSIGDLAYQQTNPTLNYANKLTNPYGKLLRIGKGQVPAGYNCYGAGTMGCNVPTDNPYYDDGLPMSTNCDIIWSYGHRNSFDFCFSPTTDSMYCSENGLNSWDEVDMVHKGGFYGWANCEGFYNNSSTTVMCTTPDIDPIEDWANPPALTGILFYSSQVMPEFDNHLLVADNDFARIYDLTLGNSPVYDQLVSRTQWQDLAGGLTTMKQASDGCVLAMKGGYTTTGLIYRICPQGLGTPEFQYKNFYLGQPYPNPTTGTSTITYKLENAAEATITLYDAFGREVSVLASGMQTSGEHQLTIDAVALGLAPGIYFCNMVSEGIVQNVNVVVE